MENGRSGGRRPLVVILAIGLGACVVPGATSIPAPAAEPPPALLGVFEDDYQNRFAISATEWLQLPHGKFNVIRWNAESRYLIAQNDPSNSHAPGMWTRIDWVMLNGMAPWEWAFCLTAYEAPTADSAEATRTARPDTPRTGCNGYPYSRMRRAP
jgi:hypothetical protein